MRQHRNQRGFTLLEVLVATALLLVGIVGLMGLFTVAAVQNAGQGDQATRTTEYAQDKMEQLMVLAFNDGSSDTTQYPACITNISTGPCTGGGLGGNMDNSTAAKGGLNTASPVAGYVDYMNSSGNPSSSSTGALYMRQWTIRADGLTPARIKTITVQVTALNSLGQSSLRQTTLVSQKANY